MLKVIPSSLNLKKTSGINFNSTPFKKYYQEKDMPFQYNFLNRDEELYALQDSFMNEVLKKKNSVSFY